MRLVLPSHPGRRWHGGRSRRGPDGRTLSVANDATDIPVCRACSTAWRWKSSALPDGGEGLAKRKGVVVRRRLKEAWSKAAA